MFRRFLRNDEFIKVKRKIEGQRSEQVEQKVKVRLKVSNHKEL